MMIASDGVNMRIRYCMIALVLATGTASAQDAKQPDKPAAPAPAPAPKVAAGASAEVKAGTGVEKREIVGEASTFAPGTTVWVWSRITNGQGSVKHVWKQDGKAVWSATLPVSSARWTTMTRRAIGAKGSWEVEVQTADGASIGSVSFTVE
jgi:hypothetical protein